MEGRGKRSRAADRSKAGSSRAGSEQPSASKQRKSSAVDLDWCADCWAAVKDACRGVHRLVDRGSAEKDVQAELKAALQEVQRVQARVDALTAARVVNGPVVSVCVEGNDEQSWYIEGGEMRISLAATKSLTAMDKKAVCAALDGLDIAYKTKGAVSTMAYGAVKVGELGGFVAKLPDCLEGQAVRKGAVLLDAKGQLEVYFGDKTAKGSRGTKVFGHVQSGLDALEGRGCDGDCERFDLDCFCRGGGAGGTTLEEVAFVARERR